MDRPPSPHPQVVGLPQSCDLAPLMGAVLFVEGSEATPLPVDFFGGCTACWYSIASYPGSGWQRGGTIWGARGADMGGVGACWARPPGHCTICALAFLSIMPLNMAALPTPGRPGGAAGTPPDGGASGGSSLQLEKSMWGRPGGGATYPDIPAAVVLGVVMPPEEAVTPYPGVCSTIWLHDWGGVGW